MIELEIELCLETLRDRACKSATDNDPEGLHKICIYIPEIDTLKLNSNLTYDQLL
ncbi:hypothetical protein [Wolbachia endosymbiont of Pentidionis agamae]|uniref:hypothetical protein n=1 Tax=Wolbachia endosymbiont of Pentidionis agamae TaxID=3110435 RepID=UPI002FD57D61